MIHGSLILPLSKINKDDIDLVGRKATEFGEIAHLGIRIPEGFVITTAAANVLKSEIFLRLLHEFYRKLHGILREKELKVFSSSKDDNAQSFVYKVKGDANLLLKIKTILLTGSPAVVQEIIKSSQKWTAYTQNPFTGDKTEIILKEDDSTSPPYVVSKKDLIVFSKGPYSSSRDDILIHKLAIITQKVQKHFYHPQYLEFAIDKEKIYLLDLKPITNIYQKRIAVKKINVSNKIANPFLKGVSAFPGIAIGPVKLFRNPKQVTNILRGEIVVAPKIDKSLFSRLKKAKALITDTESLSPKDRMIYLKNVSIPTIFSVKDATKILENKEVITVNGTKGEIYRGGQALWQI